MYQLHETLREQTKLVLARAQANLKDHWTQNAYSKDALGRTLGSEDHPEAVAWCTVGAVKRELQLLAKEDPGIYSRDFLDEVGNRVMNEYGALLAEACAYLDMCFVPDRTGVVNTFNAESYVIDYNDVGSRTEQEILEGFECAAAKASTPVQPINTEGV